MKKLFGLILLVVFAGIFILFFLSSRSKLTLDPPVQAIGIKTPLSVKVENPHGLWRFTVVIEQDGKRHVVFEQRNPSNRLLFWRQNRAAEQVSFTAGKQNAPALHDGKARLIVEAQSNDLRARTDELALEVQVVTQPPRVTADGFQHYINQGGAELVAFTPSGYWTEAGVRVGKYQFRSFALPGRGHERFSLFAYPWDLPANQSPVVYVRNPAATEATATFWNKIFPKSFRKRELELSEAFLQKVVNELDPGGSGDLLARFLKINGEMRRKNNQVLSDLRFKTEERVLWHGPFLQLANSKVESQFADVRSYMYQGKKVDEQVHLGFDLSVVKNVPVLAANDGKVIYASPLGIYGNCIVVDHGYGLQSIYGHLSQIAVKPGDTVKKNQPMGQSGDTGLAGGDHLHFSMQLDGVQINAVEWWDAHWIQDRILSKLRAPASN